VRVYIMSISYNVICSSYVEAHYIQTAVSKFSIFYKFKCRTIYVYIINCLPSDYVEVRKLRLYASS